MPHCGVVGEAAKIAANVYSLVERQGRVRSRVVPDVTAKTLREVLVSQIDAETALNTDGAGQYRHPSFNGLFASHETVDHSRGEYVRGPAHTNTIESYLALLKRGVYGVYHSVSKQHLHRYVAEFDFRYNNCVALGVDDFARTMNALLGVQGKRLTYSPAANHA